MGIVILFRVFRVNEVTGEVSNTKTLIKDGISHFFLLPLFHWHKVFDIIVCNMLLYNYYNLRNTELTWYTAGNGTCVGL